MYSYIFYDEVAVEEGALTEILFSLFFASKYGMASSLEKITFL
jgi:hypothetical protein